MREETLNKKQQVIDEIKEHLESSKSVVVAGYSGLSVADATALRNDYREKGVVYKVYKNTMVRFALEQLGYEGYEEILTGPNAFVFSKEELVDGPKISVDFAKKHKDAFTIKAGLLDGKIVKAEDVQALSELPSKEVLLSMVLRGLQGPITGLAAVSQATLRSAVYALNAIKEKKEQEAA